MGGNETAAESISQAREEDRLVKIMTHFFERWTPEGPRDAADFHAHFHSVVRAVYADMQKPVTACIKSVLLAGHTPPQIIFPVKDDPK